MPATDSYNLGLGSVHAYCDAHAPGRSAQITSGTISVSAGGVAAGCVTDTHPCDVCGAPAFVRVTTIHEDGEEDGWAKCKPGTSRWLCAAHMPQPGQREPQTPRAPDGDDYTFAHAHPPPPYHPRAYPAGPDVRTADQKVADQLADLQSAVRLLAEQVAEIYKYLYESSEAGRRRRKFHELYERLQDKMRDSEGVDLPQPEGGADGDAGA